MRPALHVLMLFVGLTLILSSGCFGALRTERAADDLESLNLTDTVDEIVFKTARLRTMMDTRQDQVLRRYIDKQYRPSIQQLLAKSVDSNDPERGARFDRFVEVQILALVETIWFRVGQERRWYEADDHMDALETYVNGLEAWVAGTAETLPAMIETRDLKATDVPFRW